MLLHFAVVHQQRRNKGLTLKVVTESEEALMCLSTLLLAILRTNWGFQSCVKCTVCPNITWQLLPLAAVAKWTLDFESGGDLLDVFSCRSYSRTRDEASLVSHKENENNFFPNREDVETLLIPSSFCNRKVKSQNWGHTFFLSLMKEDRRSRAVEATWANLT